jgi:hypothetical protein
MSNVTSSDLAFAGDWEREPFASSPNSELRVFADDLRAA